MDEMRKITCELRSSLRLVTTKVYTVSDLAARHGSRRSSYLAAAAVFANIHDLDLVKLLLGKYIAVLDPIYMDGCPSLTQPPEHRK